MSRLIDADKLIDNMRYSGGKEDSLRTISAKNLKDWINNQPTVQAVPIEEVLKIIEIEEKWLSQTRMSIRDIDIAFNAMKSKIKQIKGSDKE